jgi:hypothetical protein
VTIGRALPRRQDPKFPPLRLTNDPTPDHSGYRVWWDGRDVGYVWRALDRHGRPVWQAGSVAYSPSVGGSSALAAARFLVGLTSSPTLGEYATGRYARCPDGIPGHRVRMGLGGAACPWCAGIPR